MLFRILFLILFFFATSIVNAAEYHVATTGNDSTGDGTGVAPWRTPEYGVEQLSVGDTLYIHVGTYTLLTSNRPTNDFSRFKGIIRPTSGVDNITIVSAGDGTVFFDAGTDPTWPAFSFYQNDNCSLDDITIRGSTQITQSTGSVIKNCEIYGGKGTDYAQGGDGFGYNIRVEDTTDVIVQNCLLHDNQVGDGGQANSPIIMEYGSTNFIVEKCDIYNGVGIGIFLKDEPSGNIIRYNHIYDNALSGLRSSNQVDTDNLYIYNNIFRNNSTDESEASGAISLRGHVDGWFVYNNTFYEDNRGEIVETDYGSIDVNIWNNIYYNTNNYYHKGEYSTSDFDDWTYCNYNNFYGGASWKEETTTWLWAQISTYQSTTGFDTNSVASDPGFANTSGNMNEVDDFKRSSYPTNGRGGAYELVMGAWLSDSSPTQIGYSIVSTLTTIKGVTIK